MGPAGAGRIDGQAFHADLKALASEPRLAGRGKTEAYTQVIGEEHTELRRIADDPGPGSRAAGDYVLKRLKEIKAGLDARRAKTFQIGMDFKDKLRGKVHVDGQEFSVVRPVYWECKLIVDGKEVRRPDGRPAIYPMRHNMLQASITPAEGIEAETVYAGKGDVTEYGTRPPEGKIVVMDFDCDDNWLNAFAFGARAVIFVAMDDEKEPAPNAFHHVNLPANLPRFYVPAATAAGLGLKDPNRKGKIKIQAACEWKQMFARNIIAVLRGTDPQLGEDGKAEAIVLAAPLDSLAEVPDLACGARDAANVAGLLQIARYLAVERPRRDVILCFFDGQTMGHLGARAFYGPLFRRRKGELAKKTLDERNKDLGSELEFLNAAIAIYDQDHIYNTDGEKAAYSQAHWRKTPRFSPKATSRGKLIAEHRRHAKNIGQYHKQTILLMRNEARTFDSDVLDELRPMRIEIAELVKDLKDARDRLEGAAGGNDAARIAKLEARIADLRGRIERLAPRIERLRTLDLMWNCLERMIHEEKTDADTDAAAEYAASAVAWKRGSTKDIGDLAGIVAKVDIDDDEAVDGLFREWGDTDEEAVVGSGSEKAKRKKAQKRKQQQIRMELLKQNLPRKFRWLVGRARTICRDRRAVLVTQLIPQTNTKIALREAIGFNKTSIVLHMSLNLGEARSKWSIIHGDDSVPVYEDNVGIYNTLYKQMNEVREDLGRKVANFDPRPTSPIHASRGRLFAPGKIVDSGAVARMFSVFNVSAMTVMDRHPRQGQPADVIEALNAEAVLAQVRELAPFIKGLADSKGLSLTSSINPTAKYAEIEWSNRKMNGPSLRLAGSGGAMRQHPVRHQPLVVVSHLNVGSGDIRNAPPGFEFGVLLRSDANGLFELPAYNWAHYRFCFVIGAGFDIGEGDEPSRGLITAISTAESVYVPNLLAAAVSLCKTTQKTFVSYGFDRGPMATTPRKAMSTSTFQPTRHFVAEVGNVLALHAPYDRKGVKLFNKLGVAALNNRNTKAEYEGLGIPLADPFEHPVLTRLTARDLLTLNRYRLDLLKNNRINQESLWMLHFEAEEINKDAQSNVGKWSVHRIRSTEVASAQHSRAAYGPSVAVVNDLVTAVVLLLLLAVPFAYALERLLIGTPHIYRQIGWFMLFFLVTFALLYMVNPAFNIAATPIIIFLAFAIIVLSSLVIFIMLRKLQTEIKKVQGLGTTVHSTDVSRLSTMMAAVNMGISTMRRRRLRTLLTAITVVLLTFTILTFASFGSSWGNRRRIEGPLTGARRLLVRHQLWSPIPDGTYQTLRGFLETEADVVPRYWVSPLASEAQRAAITGASLDMMLADGKAHRTTTIAAAIGLDRADLVGPSGNRRKDMRDALDGKVELLDADGIFMTEAVRDELGLSSGDIGRAKVILHGRELIFAGSIRDALAGVTTLDGHSILPVDYQSSGTTETEQQQQQQRQELTDTSDVESAQFVHFNVDRVVIISTTMAKRMRGHLRGISIYPRKGKSQAYQSIAERVAKITRLPVYVGDQGKVERLFFTSLTKASGWRDLLIPVVLGGMIVFATMLGSVSDREREIYTFSSLGLAPPHVASLFFAEASVYAVVGGMGGYLLGQTVARVMRWLSSYFHFSAVSMNYSSTNAIVTILIVMGTVLVSTIYPAVKASRSANPGIQRAWKIPKPEGNLYDLVFPFTVSAYDITGVVSFLKEHFDNYSDTSLGVFATTACRVFRQEANDMLGFRAEVALAPFDLGVNHGFALLSRPSDIEGINEMRILVYRRSGAHGDWRRSNRVFINDLRKQLLIWRSLTHEVMDQYRRQTLAVWNDLPVELVNESTIGESA